MVDDEDEQRTYGIWGIAAFLILLAGLGAYAVIAFGTLDREPTEQVTGGPDTTSLEESVPTSSVPVTMLDGTPAPREIYEVSASPGEHSYLYTLPAGMQDEPTDSVVAPSEVEISEDRGSITVTMKCAVAEGAVPALLRVTEDPFEINVMPVVVGPSFGPPCVPDEVVGTLTVSLEEPVGARRVVVALADTPVRLGDLD